MKILTEVTKMQKQTKSIYTTGKQKPNTNQTIYISEKKTTITRTETSGRLEDGQTKFRKK